MQKVVRGSSHSTGGKKPREEKDAAVIENRPVWKLGRLDFGGPWCPRTITGEVLFEVAKKLGQLESQNWPQIDAGGSHFIPVSNLIKDAQQRLEAIRLDDIEHLYSLRLSGKERLWGIRERHVFRALWWDPEHAICPSEKKHT